MDWFKIDRVGLAKTLGRRSKSFVMHELISNAWDENVTEVRVTLEKPAGSRYAYLVVEDDNPDGFVNITHAFTLFAESAKKDKPEKRGRFNLGEKLVLALCYEAEIISTKAGVRFDATGRHLTRTRRTSGSMFRATIKMTHDEMMECQVAVSHLLPPPHIRTIFNGEPIEPREALNVVSGVTLQTEIADAEGLLRRTSRKTDIIIYPLGGGETGWLYEMGIPVVETGDSYHVDIQQKVPLNLDRDNVTPAFLRDVRTEVLNAMHEHISTETVNQPWVRDALADENVSADAIRSVIRGKFGDKVVSYDPSDLEANKRATAAGFTVVTGSQLSKKEWQNVREAGAIRPAGQVTPTPKPFSPDGNPLVIHERYFWSEEEAKLVASIERVCARLVGTHVHVVLADDPQWMRFDAAYGNNGLTLNWRRFKSRWLGKTSLDESMLDLLIHELGHHYEMDHLSSGYYKALSRLGGKLAVMAAAEPDLLAI